MAVLRRGAFVAARAAVHGIVVEIDRIRAERADVPASAVRDLQVVCKDLL